MKSKRKPKKLSIVDIPSDPLVPCVLFTFIVLPFIIFFALTSGAKLYQQESSGNGEKPWLNKDYSTMFD